MSRGTWTIEMSWECSYCRRVNPGMSGAERQSLKCSGCGAEKDHDRWVMPGDLAAAPRLTGALDAAAREGAAWACAHCKSMSRASKGRCEVCGAARHAEDAIVAAAEPEPTAPWSEVTADLAEPERADYRTAPSSGPVTAASGEAEDDEAPVRRVTVNPEAVFRGVLAVGAIVCALAFIAWLCEPNETTVRVSALSWSRTRRLEEQHEFTGEGWRSQAPPDVVSWDGCESRQSGTRDCDPYECRCRREGYDCRCSGGEAYDCRCRPSCTPNRNGSATCRDSCSTCYTPKLCDTCYRRSCDTCYRQCPVYAEWCSYRYRRWDAVREASVAGSGHTASWPRIALDEGVARGPRHFVDDQRYTVRFDDTSSERTWDREYGFARYERFVLGERWRATWNRAGYLGLRSRVFVPSLADDRRDGGP